ncbi:MSHA biogenesis protein MshD [Enterovibrio norvegicus]|uniref:type IV pilus modification PilV family protein n=1 Tax=Enterovibrio norvegicus TaxID=188144 RepID=UPI000C846A28|nr:type II secretion system protein [Enterovibrio norvegicus]MCC4799516.1 type II secretion system GspH family protein [Enterovibrio norvegicus]PMI31588.1 MSHA biogenesis protein MshD [Enterovibrio norvegicus]PMI36778.1 MSHA biogenesis protein MshD [Enterovibrio norvegicus]PMN50229.1 MSHA biogenesis protein MshD [Enterovibrio norvegicus]TKF16918.1 type II secretion system protein [Enterovibrio norvegicus]
MPVTENTSKDSPPISHHQRGFTLVELVIGIVVFGVAMVLISTTLFPMFAKSANPHFEARAAALGQAVMSEVLARQFDRNSDPNGSQWRCDENADAVKALGIPAPDTIPACTPTLVAGDGFAATEDYIGCWGADSSICSDTDLHKGSLHELIGGSADDYLGFTVDINVTYDDSTFTDSTNNSQLYKRIDMVVDTGQFGRFDFTAYRSNF